MRLSPSSQPPHQPITRPSIDAILTELQESLSVISPELIPLHERLVNIRRKLAALAAKDKFKQAEIKPLLEDLRKIDSLSVFIVNRVDKLRLNGFPLSCLKYGTLLGSLNNLILLLPFCGHPPSTP